MRAPRKVSGEAAQAIAQRAAEILAAHPQVKLVFLFGSAADPSRESVRDVDLAVLSRPRLSIDALMKLRADAAIAAGTDIDVVSLNDASVVLAWEVAQTGICLYATTPEAETEFVTRARARYWDFKPFLEKQWELAGERLKERRHGPQT